jgi:hypothetical protein
VLTRHSVFLYFFVLLDGFVLSLLSTAHTSTVTTGGADCVRVCMCRAVFITHEIVIFFPCLFFSFYVVTPICFGAQFVPVNKHILQLYISLDGDAAASTLAYITDAAFIEALSIHDRMKLKKQHGNKPYLA